MSWDVIVQNFRGQPPEDELADGEPLGTAAAIRKKIDAHLPGIKWFDDRRGIYQQKGFAIEFSIGSENPIRHVMLAIHGGSATFEALKAIAIPNKWSLFDCSESEFLDLESATAPSFEAFQACRDRVLPKGSVKGKLASGKKQPAKRASKKSPPKKSSKRKKSR